MRGRPIWALAALLVLGVSALLLSRASHEAGAVELPQVAHDMKAQDYLPRPGAALPNQTRRVAQNQGKNGVDVYVFPTTEGKVCSVVTESAAMGGCVPSFRLVKGEVAWSVYSGETAPQTAAGLASNRVAAIEVRVRDHLEPVAMVRNTFFWQAPTSDVTRGDIKGLVVRWHDGRTFDVNLDFGDP
jgi:hypothetical protein